MVPPETPGTLSANAMQKPRTAFKTYNYFLLKSLWLKSLVYRLKDSFL